jgi:ATP-binding cassette subfamily F protein 3
VLLLDEPTNHLDVESVEALAEALKGYLGTILFTCHDRAFTATVATQLVEVKDGQVAIYPGDYALYCQRLEQEAERAEPAAKPAKEKASAPADRGQAERTKRQLQAIERQLATLNAEKTEIEDKLAQDYDEAACNRLADLLEEIRVAEERWMALSEPTTTAT